MSEPRWVSRYDVEYLHQIVVEVGGGSHGLRDAALLESALARPQNQYAYAEAISRNHPFVDGNKRTAFQTCYQFLKDNGYHLSRAKGIEHAEMMEQLGQGKITRDQAATHLGEHSSQIRQK